MESNEKAEMVEDVGPVGNPQGDALKLDTDEPDENEIDDRDDEEDCEEDVGEPDEQMKKTTVKALSKTKNPVPGIVYLGHIPPRLRPKHMRNMLSLYGEIGRIFLQPEDRSVKKKKRKAGTKACSFTEGWVEFRDKRVAKAVASSLHTTPMGSRKRCRFSSDLWCIKYLHRFQWCHLSERLAYEQTVLQQRLRTEISQAKRETNFYLANVEKSDRLERLRRKRERKGEPAQEKLWDFTQRRTEEEIQRRWLSRGQQKARSIQEKAQSNVALLAKIFNRDAAHE